MNILLGPRVRGDDKAKQVSGVSAVIPKSPVGLSGIQINILLDPRVRGDDEAKQASGN